MTRHRSVSMLLGTLTAAAALVASVSAPASAAIVDRAPSTTSSPVTDEDFCGAGLDVDFDGTVDGRFRVNSRAPGRLRLLRRERQGRQRLHRPGDRPAVTDIQPNTLGKDQSITDNGDGTITIIVLLTGGERTYGDDGKLIARNSGQVRFEIVYDYVNDVEISNELIFGSTGTNDDFCEAVLTDWGYL